MPNLSYNKGEWAEVYVFFKVIVDRRLYTADADFNRLKDIYLDILGVIREEVIGKVYTYKTGETVRILLNGEKVMEVPVNEFAYQMNVLWGLLSSCKSTTFSSEKTEIFLNSIFIQNPKSPAAKISRFCGGTVDITVETRDKSGIVRILGFSIKSDLSSSATLLNASGDNTNFIFEVTGPIDDEKMIKFNGLFKRTIRKGEVCQDVATSDRMQYLKSIGCDISYYSTAKSTCYANLVQCCGKEMPEMIGGMLKHYYYDNFASRTDILECVDYLADNDVVGYKFDDLKRTYNGKLGYFLLCVFTGMRLGTRWDGRQQVNGGYIVVKNDGDVVAYHSTISDEFKDFLVAKTHMERPSHSRHGDMVIYKEDGKYFLKLGLQIRFSLSR